MGKNLLKEIEDFGGKIIKDDKFKRVTEKVLKKMSEEEYPFPVGYRSNLEMAKSYAELANQVVGAEWDRNY